MGKKSMTEAFRKLGREGGSRKDFINLYKSYKRKKQVLPIDPNQEFFDKIMERYGEKKGGLITGKPKLAKKGWR
tara:strand:+ start:240 stop:461 length:222 start_codon:yes stop_codon:yes gene_type:complete